MNKCTSALRLLSADAGCRSPVKGRDAPYAGAPQLQHEGVANLGCPLGLGEEGSLRPWSNWFLKN